MMKNNKPLFGDDTQYVEWTGSVENENSLSVEDLTEAAMLDEADVSYHHRWTICDEEGGEQALEAQAVWTMYLNAYTNMDPTTVIKDVKMCIDAYKEMNDG